MTRLEKRIQELEMRPAAFDAAEQTRRGNRVDHVLDINRFEGMVASAVDERLFKLLISGKINKQEYRQLCLDDARGVLS